MRITKFRVYNDLLKNYLPDDSVCILPNGDIVLYNLAAMIAAYNVLPKCWKVKIP